jgi:hypothetical protein
LTSAKALEEAEPELLPFVKSLPLLEQEEKRAKTKLSKASSPIEIRRIPFIMLFYVFVQPRRIAPRS